MKCLLRGLLMGLLLLSFFSLYGSAREEPAVVIRPLEELNSDHPIRKRIEATLAERKESKREFRGVLVAINFWDTGEEPGKFTPYAVLEKAMDTDEVKRVLESYVVIKIDPRRERENLLDEVSYKFHDNTIPTILRYDVNVSFVDRKRGSALLREGNVEKTAVILVELYDSLPAEKNQTPVQAPAQAPAH